MRTIVISSLVLVSMTALAGCAAPQAGDSRLAAVASTNVYGGLVQEVGGDLVEVTSIIDSPTQDPHSYEASAQDQLAVSRADLIVMNGGGYDSFMTVLIDASNTGAALIDAVEVSGLEGEADHEGEAEHEEEAEHEDDGHAHDHGAFNEHVWYDFHAIEQVVDAIVDELSLIDPDNAATFAGNADELLDGIESLEARAEALVPLADGRGAATTEPVPVYLLEAVGLHDDSPSEFTEAIEEGDDVPPAALQDMLELLAGDHIALLAYNSQTASPETERVRVAAEGAGVPVVDFTETVPEGQTYLSWMNANLDTIEAALST